MRIGIAGAGNIGGTLAQLFAAAGHDVALSNSRGPESLAPLIADIDERTGLGPAIRAMTIEDAARFGDVVVLAVPWRTPEALPPVDAVRGKIVVDAMNPYAPDFSVIDLGHSTSSEETARRLPGARLVKAFNTMHFGTLRDAGDTTKPMDERLALYVAGDDEAAKAVVAHLIEDIGFAPVDTGTLREGGLRQQPGTALYNQPRTAAEARAVLATL